MKGESTPSSGATLRWRLAKRSCAIILLSYRYESKGMARIGRTINIAGGTSGQRPLCVAQRVAIVLFFATAKTSRGERLRSPENRVGGASPPRPPTPPDVPFGIRRFTRLQE